MKKKFIVAGVALVATVAWIAWACPGEILCKGGTKMNEGWLQILSLFLANAGLIIWFRSESRSDWRHMDNKLDASIKAIQEEMKDFHSKLIELEVKNKMRTDP